MFVRAGHISLHTLQKFVTRDEDLELHPEYNSFMSISARTVNSYVDDKKVAYGITTGFGSLANKSISNDKIKQLQHNLVLSHATGIGDHLPDEIVRLVLLLKINSLAQGYSGVRPIIAERLLTMLNKKLYPAIPSQGSVGACGDLAPLAHMALTLMGEGELKHAGELFPSSQVLQKEGLEPIELEAKEGIALVNGVQVSNAIAIQALFYCERLWVLSTIIGSLTLEATRSSLTPFSENLNKVSRHITQQQTALYFRGLLDGTNLCVVEQPSHRVQEPYSLRCQPQILGATLSNLLFSKKNLLDEANSVSDNPIVCSEENVILSGGNFHGESIAYSADLMALSIAEMTTLSERRLAILCDHEFSGLPPFLVEDYGLNSGFMNAQVTAAALTHENRALSIPSVTDTIKTSANQEDHVSMSTYAAYRLLRMIKKQF